MTPPYDAGMAVTDSALVAAIETSLFMYPPSPGLTTDLSVPGMRGRVTDLSHPLANLVGDARLGDAEADDTIASIKDRFMRRRRPLGG